MKKLMVYLKGYKKECILAPLFKMLEAFFDLLVPLIVADIINVGIINEDRTYIIQRVILLAVLALAGMLSSFTAQYFSSKASVGFGTKLRQALFDHIQSLSYAEIDKLGTDTLITRLTSDINQIQTGVNLTLRLLLRSPFIVFGAVIMAFIVDARSAWIFVIALPILSVVIFGIMLVTIPLYRKVQSALDTILRITRENLTGVRVIRAFCKEQDEIDEFDRANAELTRRNEFVGRISALMNPGSYFLIQIATIALIWVGALRVNSGLLLQGDVVALYNYMAQIIVELIKLASLIITINKSLACAERVSAVLDVESSIIYSSEDAQLKESEEAVCFDHVSLTYGDAAEASLEDISFTAFKGQTIGIIGGTGSGKSSLVNMIPRFYDAAGGQVSLFGTSIQDFSKTQLSSTIGIVPQRAVLFEGSIRDNLKWRNENATDEELWDALTIAQAKDVVENKAGQLDYLLEQNGRNLSGGQKQRLTIARALVGNPDILIMDDSASALDFATDASLRKAISNLRKDMTVFIVSQRTSSVRSCDRILVMEDGKLVGSGTHTELLETCPVYQEIYYSQFPEERKEVLA